MRRSKFTDVRIAFPLRQAEEGTPVAEVCRKAGISEATSCNWRKRYGGLMPSEIRRLRQLARGGEPRPAQARGRPHLDKEMLQEVIRRKMASVV